MGSKIHILGNGDLCQMMPDGVRYGDNRDGKLLVCNSPPFEVEKVYAAIIVDFKMCGALHEGSISLDRFRWVMGNRPKIFCDQNPQFYLKHSHRIREFYTDVPKYCDPTDMMQAATNFNCGHMATHYASVRHQPDEIHMYGFDSIFDHNMRSYTDTVLSSDRGDNNNYRLLDIWRPIWFNIFKEFPHIKYVLCHKHPNAKITLPKNVEVVTKT